MSILKEVEITVLNADGDFRYSRSVANLSAEDTVNFKLGALTTQFKLTFTHSPFIDGITQQLFESTGADVAAVVHTGVPPGPYRYQVSALYTGLGSPPGGTWFSDTSCPEIVVK
jgi:hypothetical protein